MTNMDKLYEAVAARGPVCVGLDTDFSYLPADFVDTTLTKGENIVRFNKKLIDATKAVAGCYKVQIAYYESLGLEGMKAYAETIPDTFAYNEDQIVSRDIVGETHGSIFDATQTMCSDLGNGQTLVQVTSWYDNENSYTSQMVRTIKYFAELK